MLGALGIYVEFTSPGLIVPGVSGAILVLLGLSALSVLPINWLGAALLLLAFALFVLEAKFASHGILARAARSRWCWARCMLVDSPLPEMRIQLATAIALALPFSAHHDVAALAGGARAAQQSSDRQRRHDRRDRRGRHRAGARTARSSCTANIGMPCRARPVAAGSARAGDRNRQAQTHGGTDLTKGAST